MSEAPQVVVVTGLSGAGRSSALRVLEDAGFFCVDNLPPGLAPELLVWLAASDGSSSEWVWGSTFEPARS